MRTAIMLKIVAIVTTASAAVDFLRRLNPVARANKTTVTSNHVRVMKSPKN